MQYRFFPLFLFLLFLTGCASSPTKDTIFLPQIFNLPCIFLERTIEPYDTSNYLPYASLRENAPSITTFYPLPFTGDIHTSYAYNLGYLPADFHTISLQCTNREYYAPIDNPGTYHVFPYITYFPQKRNVAPLLILDFLQALQHQEFQKAETLMNETLQNQGGRANLLPFHQRKILTSKAGENVLFVLSENGTSQDVAYLIQKVFIQDHMLVMEPLYTLYILQPSFKNPTPSLSEQQEKCRQRYLEDQTIEKNVLRKENVLNTLNSYLDEETSINLCTAFFAYYSQHTYENVNAATIIGFTGYEATAKERFDTRYSFSFVPPEPNSTFAEIYQAIRLGATLQGDEIGGYQPFIVENATPCGLRVYTITTGNTNYHLGIGSELCLGGEQNDVLFTSKDTQAWNYQVSLLDKNNIHPTTTNQHSIGNRAMAFTIEKGKLLLTIVDKHGAGSLDGIESVRELQENGTRTPIRCYDYRNRGNFEPLEGAENNARYYKGTTQFDRLLPLPLPECKDNVQIEKKSGFSSLSPLALPEPERLTLDYFRQQIREGKEIDFSEYFYATAAIFSGTYSLCEENTCLLSPNEIAYKEREVEGYFTLSPKEEYFLCTETDDPTCFPPATGVDNLYFVITSGDMQELPLSRQISFGCYDKKHGTMLYERDEIDTSTMTYQKVATQFPPDTFDIVLQNLLEYMTKEQTVKISLSIPTYESIIQDGRKCPNFYYRKDTLEITAFTGEKFDKEGYNKEGYNQLGYNKRGYNASGYDKRGYNSSGYDKRGYDSSGYDEGGYDIWLYHKEWGYKKWGYFEFGEESRYDEGYGLPPPVEQHYLLQRTGNEAFAQRANSQPIYTNDPTREIQPLYLIKAYKNVAKYQCFYCEPEREIADYYGADDKNIFLNSFFQDGLLAIPKSTLPNYLPLQTLGFQAFDGLVGYSDSYLVQFPFKFPVDKATFQTVQSKAQLMAGEDANIPSIQEATGGRAFREGGYRRPRFQNADKIYDRYLGDDKDWVYYWFEGRNITINRVKKAPDFSLLSA